MRFHGSAWVHVVRRLSAGLATVAGKSYNITVCLMHLLHYNSNGDNSISVIVKPLSSLYKGHEATLLL